MLNTPMKFVPELPATCSPDKNETVVVYKSTVPRGIFYCVAENTWSNLRSFSFNAVIGKPATNLSLSANVWTDAHTLGLLPSTTGGAWDIDAKIQIESGIINALQSCQFALVVRDTNAVIVETLDEATVSKGAILTLKNYTPVSFGGRYLHSGATPMNAVLRVNCTTAQTMTASGTWIRAEYRK